MNEQPQKIVVLVDGSAYSASVCDHAAWVSERTGAPVELIHVLGRREAPEKQNLSGAIALGARTALYLRQYPRGAGHRHQLALDL